MSQKLPVNNTDWMKDTSQFIENFIKNYNKESESELNCRLVLKKVHRVIKFNQNAWLKLYIDMNTGLRKKAKNDFEKYFFNLMNKAVFRKSIGNKKNTEILKLSQQKEEETIWC